MICPNCGKEIEGGLRFCTSCGAEARPAARKETPAAGQKPQAPPTPAGWQPQATQPPVAPQPQPPQVPPMERYAAQAPPPAQPTTQMPVQPYRQPAPGYGPAYAVQPGYRAAGAGYGSAVLGVITMLMGAVVAASAFLSWVSVMGYGATGWSMMINGAAASGFRARGFYIVITGEGLIFFTGFLAMLLGVLITVGGLVLLGRSRAGGIITLLFGVAATAVAAIDIAMVYTKMQPVSPGVGLWMFAGASLTALVLGIVGMASPG